MRLLFLLFLECEQINDPAALVEQLSIAVQALDPRSPGQEVGSALRDSIRVQ